MRLAEQTETEYSIGFDILSVGMNRFNKYSQLSVVNFDQQFTSIEGPTGAGKSSVLDTITFSLFGKNSRTDVHAKMEDVVKDGGYAYVEFEKNGNHYRVKRGRMNDGSSFIELKINGDRFHGNIKAINPEIIRIVGMDYDAFVASSIIRQNEMTLFSSSTPAKRLERLQRLFHLNVFEKALDKAKDDRKRIENEITNLKGEIEGISRVMGGEDELRRSIDTNTSEVIHLITERKDERTTLENLESNIKEMENERKEMAVQVEKKGQIESSIDEIASRVTRLNIDVNDLDDQIVSAREKLPDEDMISLLSTKTPELRDLESKQKSLESAINARDKTRSEQERRYNDLREKYKGGISLDEYTEFAITVGEASALVVDELDELKDELESKKPQVVKGVVSEVLDTEIGIGDVNDNLEKELMDTGYQIGELRSSLGVTSSSEAERIISSIATQTKSIEFMEKEIEGKRDAIKEAKELKQKKDEEIVSIFEVVVELEKKLSGDDELVALTKDQKKKVDSISDKIAELKGIIKTNKANLETIGQYKDMIDENKRKLDSLNEELDTVNEIAENVLHKRGVTMYAVETIMGAVELRASELLNYMTSGQLSVLRFETTNQGFEIYVDDDLAAVKSGGEQVQLNASIRFAIAQKMSEIATMGAKMKTLFIDEGDLSSLDEESARVRFIDTIFALDRYFKKVIMITHMPDITENFDTHVRIEKVGDVSRIVG